MKTILTACLALFLLTQNAKAQAQESTGSEKYGKTLNLGLGFRPYTNQNYISPAFHLNYEFDIAKNLTLAPFISLYQYKSRYYWGGPNSPYRDYRYKQTIIPVGVKVSYYFDQLFKAGSDWDFYAAGSGGIEFRTTTWEDGYYGETTAVSSSARLYLAAHFGAEYHVNQKIGFYLDLSTNISTIGIAIHM